MTLEPYPGVLGAAQAGDFERAALVFGLLLVLGALVSGLARRSFLALTPVFVLMGFALGRGGLEVLHFDPTSGFVAQLASVALVVILFRDGLEVESELLQKAWHLPARKLVIAMPVTAGIVAVATRGLTDLGWTECLLVGALLAPTDPVLSSGVVTNPRVPRIVRHSLNLESGLNDGLALAPVLALVAVLSSDSDFVWWRFVAQDIGLGLAFGVVIGFLASLALPRGSARAGGIPSHQRSLYALGVAFATYGATVLPPSGNGYVAVFVCAITLGIRRPDIRSSFAQHSEDVVEIVKLGVFVVFGSLLTLDGLTTDGLAALALVLVTLLLARPVGVLLALAGSATPRAQLAFMAWFGPKGVATMAFSLLVLAATGVAAGERIFNLCAVVVLCSIVAHGLSDTPGVGWIARRTPRAEAP